MEKLEIIDRSLERLEMTREIRAQDDTREVNSQKAEVISHQS
jgi:hypothetical protein